MNTREMVTAALFAALTAAGSYVSIPIQPVPFTFQVLFVLMAGLLLRPLAAAASMLVYVLLGAIGLPVFSGGAAGLGVIVGPTGGYLGGFILAAFLVSILAGPRTSRTHAAWRLIACVAGLVVIYGLGMTQLAVVAGMSPPKAFLAGVLPFLPLDAVKSVIAVAAAAALERAVGPLAAAS